MAIDHEKLRLLRAVTEQMNSLLLADINMVLYEAGVMELPDYWEGDDRYGPTDDATKKRIAATTLRDLTPTQLREISTALQQVFEAPEIGINVADERPLRLFASHLNTQQLFVKRVADILTGYGISLFVAHEDVAVDDEWHAAIESSLQSVHGGVVFLRPQIVESKWCDQEVGWLLGRGVPVLGLKFSGQDPYGPFGKKQAQTVPDNATAEVVATSIAEWVNSKPQLRNMLVTSLSQALQNSNTFAMTNEIWKYLSTNNDLDATQVATITSAIRDNDQVYAAQCRVGNRAGESFRVVIFDFLKLQPGFAENKDLIKEAQELREYTGFASKAQAQPSVFTPLPQAVKTPWNEYTEPPF